MSTITYSQAFKFLTESELKEMVPSAFTEQVSPRVSDGYVPLKTPELLKHFALYGWYPVRATEVQPKKEENKGFQKHFIYLRNKDCYVGTPDAINHVPEALLVNSYDARSMMKIFVNLFRVVCGNNLLVKASLMEEFGIIHAGEGYRNIDSLISQMSSNVRKSIALTDEMKAIEMTLIEQKAFARACCCARWDYKHHIHTTNELLEPLREEDEGSNLWIVFNRLQEKIIKGGWVGAGGRTIKPLKDSNRALNVNAKLFAEAEYFLHKRQRHEKKN